MEYTKKYVENLEKRLERAERKLSCGYETGQGQNCGECLDCLKVNNHFLMEGAGHLKEALERAERERDEVKAWLRHDYPAVANLQRHAEAAEARAQKAEAVVEAARQFAYDQVEHRELLAALTAYDEPPTGDVSLCVLCGKGWPKGMSGAATSVKHPGRWQHFPNCPVDEPPTEQAT